MTINKPNPISVQNIVGIHQSVCPAPKNKPKNPTNPIITITAVIIPMMRSNVVITCSFIVIQRYDKKMKPPNIFAENCRKNNYFLVPSEMNIFTSAVRLFNDCF